MSRIQPEVGIVDYDHYLIECHWDLHSLIDGIGLLKDRTSKDRPLAVPAPLLRKDPVFQIAPSGIIK
jgi:hypothetical protein